MDFISWSEVFKVCLILIVLGTMIAAIVATFAFAMFMSVVMWHGMKAKKRTPEQLLADAALKLEQEEER